MQSKAKIDFIVNLHKKNSQRLGFIPKSRVEQYVNYQSTLRSVLV